MVGIGRLTHSIRQRWRNFRERRRAKLSTEVSACLPVLELIQTQILDVVQKGNHATDDLSQSFGSMAERAREVVLMATESRQNESRSEVDQVREVVSELLLQVRRTSQSTQETANLLTAIEKDVQDVESCMVKIEDIANRSRMVSLNGQIEAARAGEHGDGFAVVASETGDLAQNVSEASQRIREVVDRLADSLRETHRKTHDLVTIEQEATATCEQRVEQMLTALAEYQLELESNLESTKSSSDELAGAITQSVMTLQFQDAVSQRMHHVTKAIGDIRESFESIVGERQSSAAKKLSEQWLEKVSAAYCVDDEHRVLKGESALDSPSPSESNIELF